MNKRTKEYSRRIADVVKKFSNITKAIIIGPATEETFAFDEDIMLAVYTKPEANIAKTCVDLNNTLGDNTIFNVDIYMMADEDFYMEVHDLIDTGEVIVVNE